MPQSELLYKYQTLQLRFFRNVVSLKRHFEKSRLVKSFKKVAHIRKKNMEAVKTILKYANRCALEEFSRSRSLLKMSESTALKMKLALRVAKNHYQNAIKNPFQVLRNLNSEARTPFEDDCVTLLQKLQINPPNIKEV